MRNYGRTVQCEQCGEEVKADEVITTFNRVTVCYDCQNRFQEEKLYGRSKLKVKRTFTKIGRH